MPSRRAWAIAKMRSGVAFRSCVTQVAELIGIRIQPVHPDVEHAQRLLNHLGETAADGHDLADALHLASDAG